MKHPFNWALFDALPVIGIMRNFPEQHVQAVVTQYQRAGFSSLEITMNSGNPVKTIQHLREKWGDQMNIGAGTICTMKDLETALDAGAQFIVAPIVSKQVIKACIKAAIPVFPGAMTPTEIYKAQKWGASMIKVFPAGKLGPGYLKDVLEPLNGAKLLPTGGVNPDNFIDFLQAGAKGAGIGSALFPKDIIAAERWEDLYTFYSDFARKYQQYKAESAPR